MGFGTGHRESYGCLGAEWNMTGFLLIKEFELSYHHGYISYSVKWFPRDSNLNLNRNPDERLASHLAVIRFLVDSMRKRTSCTFQVLFFLSLPFLPLVFYHSKTIVSSRTF